MLIVEYQSNGRHIVKIRKDWHPGRIGRSYTPPAPANLMSYDACKIQELLLKKPKGKR